ncbi:MAG: hypothetical protein QOC94_2077, partial [Actinoplanes sp.]|nr:hypothetical protein [Actinoplanes sp.]
AQLAGRARRCLLRVTAVCKFRAVRFHRRHAADLVLISAERAYAEAELVEVASQLLAQLVRVSPDLVNQVLPMACHG